jgi:hypothetical protein
VMVLMGSVTWRRQGECAKCYSFRGGMRCLTLDWKLFLVRR